MIKVRTKIRSRSPQGATTVITAASQQQIRTAQADYATQAGRALHADTATDLTGDSPLRLQFAYKDRDDVIAGVWSLLQGLQTAGYTPGPLGVGGAINRDPETGAVAIDTDYLTVRRKATFNILEMMHAFHVGGQVYLSPGGAEIIAVDPAHRYWADTTPLSDATGAALCDTDGNRLTAGLGGEAGTCVRCYIRTSDKQGTEVCNTLAVGDQALCQTFNLASGQRYYWRRVVGAGADYVDLSLTDCAPGSIDAPHEGDTIVVFGSTDPARRHAIALSAYGPGAPSIRLYKGIDTYSTAGREKTVLSPAGSRFTGEVVVRTADGTETALAEFLANAINLAVGPQGTITLNGNTRVVDGQGNLVALFADGKIAAGLVEATAIRTAQTGARTVIEGNSQQYYDDAGVLRLLIDAGSIADEEAAAGTDTQQYSLSGSAPLTDTVPRASLTLAELTPEFRTVVSLPYAALTLILTLAADPIGSVGGAHGSASVVLYVQRYDAASGQWITMATPWRQSIALAPPGTPQIYRLSPGDLIADGGLRQRIIADVTVTTPHILQAGLLSASGTASGVCDPDEQWFSHFASDGGVVRADSTTFAKVTRSRGVELRAGNFGLKIDPQQGFMATTQGPSGYQSITLT